MKKLLSILFFGLVCGQLFSQKLPREMRLLPAEHRLKIGGVPTTGLFDESVIHEINLDFPQSNYWTLLTNNYQSKTDIQAKMTIGGEVRDSVGVRFRGQTSYSMTQNSQKKSFNISLDFNPNFQKLDGYKTFQLNNCFDDRSFLREFFYLNQIRNYIPGAKANFCHLSLNGQDWGIYPFVQQLNKDFYEEWFLSNNGTNWRADRPPGATGGGMGGGWGDGTAALNYLSPADSTSYKKYYTLKSTDSATPWTDLINTCDALVNTPLANLETELPAFLDIDRTLWFLACEIAWIDDDSYVYKGKMDYYLWFEPETGRITPIEYDGNSTMLPNLITSWSPFYNANKVNYPLLNRVLAVPAWRQRYLAHFRTIIEERFAPAVTQPILDAMAAQIDALVSSDPKKLYTYNQFKSEVTVLKNFIATRQTNILANAEIKQLAPTISDAAQFFNDVKWASPDPSKEVWIQATAAANGASGLESVWGYWATGFVGNFTRFQLFDDGSHHDGAASDGIFGGSIPAQAQGVYVRWYVEAVASTTAKSVSYFPKGAEHDVFIWQVLPENAAATTVVINEIMAANKTGATDEKDQTDDWIELFNTTGQAVDLSGWQLTDNGSNIDKWTFPAGTVLPAAGYLILWADEDSAQGPLHTNFKLSASGENLILLNNLGLVADEMGFGQQTDDVAFARIPNGSGPFKMQAPTFGGNNEIVSIDDEIQANTTFSFQPNPVSDRLEIRVDFGDEKGSGRLKISDSAGREIWSQLVENQRVETSVDVQNWSTGTYFLSVENERGEQISGQFVKID